MGAFSLKLPHRDRESALLFNLELLFLLIDTTAVNAPHPNIHTVRSIALLCPSKKNIRNDLAAPLIEGNHGTVASLYRCDCRNSAFPTEM